MSDMQSVGTITDAYGQVLDIGQDRDGWYLEADARIGGEVVPVRIVIGGSVRDDVMKKIFAADELATRWAEENEEAHHGLL